MEGRGELVRASASGLSLPLVTHSIETTRHANCKPRLNCAVRAPNSVSPTLRTASSRFSPRQRRQSHPGSATHPYPVTRPPLPPAPFPDDAIADRIFTKLLSSLSDFPTTPTVYTQTRLLQVIISGVDLFLTVPMVVATLHQEPHFLHDSYCWQA